MKTQDTKLGKPASEQCLSCWQQLVGPQEISVQRLHNREPELTTALGAWMTPIAMHRDWPERLAPLRARDVRLPTPQEIKDSLWISQEGMREVRDYTCYECTDLRIAVVQSNGELLVAYCRRTDPHRDPESLRTHEMNPFSEVHTAPINDFLWPIGGRRMCPAPGSPLASWFTEYHSALLKAHKEAHVQPEHVLGLYDLGLGRMEYRTSMQYRGWGRDTDGELRQEIRNVETPHPQQTLGRNFVILVDHASLRLQGNESVRDIQWLSSSEYRATGVREKCTHYEQQFLDALFEGWAQVRNGGMALKTFSSK
jgi:hypothetical protein